MTYADHVKRLTPAEKRLVKYINEHWSRAQALDELKSHLQTAIEVELATIPIYLFAYYSINRTPAGFPDTALAQFADRAGASIMSVAVEEMLHMSL
ncbi:MAG TPA: ferritin-like domain-containing protein, partial [Cellvibrionaceae bacterium]|nr:ferritin-like domain-containing protein [Cellvibrionaceae bacterium]